MPNFTIFTLLASLAAPLFAAACPPPLNHRPPSTDTIPPVITCPPNVTLTLGQNGCDTTYTYTVTATDNLPGVVVAKVYGIASGQNFPAGTTINLYIAVDAAGNTTTCSFSVHVASNPPATVYCRDMVTRSLGSNCTLVLPPSEFLEPPFGCLDAYSAEVDRSVPFGNGPWDPANFVSGDLGKTFQFRVTNLFNGNKCWGDIKLVDSLPPAPVCPSINVPCALPLEHLTPIFLADSLGFSAGRPVVMDNCPGTNTLSFTDVSVNLPCGSPADSVTGYISRTWIAWDISGNSAHCTQTINRVRSLQHVLFPSNDTLFCAAPNAPPSVTGGPFVSVGGRRYSLLTAPFCEMDAFYDDSIETTCGGGKRIRRVWDVRDLCLPPGIGNPVFATQYIVVRDTMPPIANCPSDTVYLIPASNDCRVPLVLPEVLLQDDCSPISDATAFWIAGTQTKILSGTVQVSSGNGPSDSTITAVFGMVDNFPAGPTDMLYVFSDACGNVFSCEFQIEVWDSIPPKASCDSLVSVYLGTDGQGILPAQEADNGSEDDCSGTAFKIRRDTTGPCAVDIGNWQDHLVFCCNEIGDTLPATVRVYDVVLPPGEVSDTFALGQFSECSVRIVVLDTLGPVCVSPTDVSISCDAFTPQMDAYGLFTYSCSSDSIFETVIYSQFDTVCRTGIIIRHLDVIDTSIWESNTCIQRITVGSMPQHFYVRFPDDKIALGCDSVGGFDGGAPVLYGEGCENLVATYTDEVFKVVPDACLKIDRTWTIINTCTHNPALPLVTVPNPNPSNATNHAINLPGPVVSAPDAAPPWVATTVAINPGQTPTNFSTFWSADANGYRYKQILKLIDTQKPLLLNCPASDQTYTDESGNDNNFWNSAFWFDPLTGSNDLCEGAINLCMSSTDLCADTSVTMSYTLFLDLDHDGTQETAVVSTHAFQANTVYYNNVKSTGIGGGTPRQFDFRLVPTNQKYGFTIQTTTSGRDRTACVVWKNSTNPPSFATPQLPYGTHRIRWIATDACGNANSCEYVFTIENSAGICGNSLVPVTGNILTETGAGILGVNVHSNRSLPSTPDWSSDTTTNINGKYTLEIPTGGTYSIRPEHDVAPLNGVSTLDMLLINKHILGLDTLDSPYKLVAADANNSRTVTTFDIVELRKLILGLYTKFPNNSSWRFVDDKYVFPQTGNPLQTAFPETQTGQNHLPANPPVHNFIGVKIGDVNGNAFTSATETIVENRDAPVIALDLPDWSVRAGEIIEVPVVLSDQVAGLQFTLATSGLDILDLLPGVGMSADNFAVFQEDGLIAVSWLGDVRPYFSMRLRAHNDLRLSDHLGLSARVAIPEAYLPEKKGYRTCDLALRFGQGEKRPLSVELFQNRPNPFDDASEIGFYLPAEMYATLRVFDTAGRERFTHGARYSPGLHTILLTKDRLGGATGVLHYVLETEGKLLSKKMTFLAP